MGNFQRNYRAKDVQNIFGIGHSSLYDYTNSGILPKQIKLGRSSVWLGDEIDSVIDAHKAAREVGIDSVIEALNAAKEGGIDAAIEALKAAGAKEGGIDAAVESIKSITARKGGIDVAIKSLKAAREAGK